MFRTRAPLIAINALCEEGGDAPRLQLRTRYARAVVQAGRKQQVSRFYRPGDSMPFTDSDFGEQQLKRVHGMVTPGSSFGHPTRAHFGPE